MNENIKELTALVEAKGRESGNEYAFCAGYYESMLSHLAREIPEVDNFLQRRVNYLTKTG
jgi:hypothetical protein